MVTSRSTPPTLPSDLTGITAATFAERADGNLAAAIGPAATQIRQAMQAVQESEPDVDGLEEPLEPAA